MKTPGPSRSPTVTREDAGPSSPAVRFLTRGGSDPGDDDDLAREVGAEPTRTQGGLRIAPCQTIQEDLSEHQRHMQVDDRNFPKRKKVTSEKFVFQPSTLDKLIIGT
jgi:ATP-dependent RNA helicase DDX49/DBP8